MYGSVLLLAGLYRVKPLDYQPLDIHYGTPRLVQLRTLKCTRSCSVQAAKPLRPARSGSTARTSSAPGRMSARE